MLDVTPFMAGSPLVYRGEVHRGEHAPILARDLCEAVQAKRAANAVARQLRLRGSAPAAWRRCSGLRKTLTTCSRNSIAASIACAKAPSTTNCLTLSPATNRCLQKSERRTQRSSEALSRC
jgi:hypothetical protein